MCPPLMRRLVMLPAVLGLIGQSGEALSSPLGPVSEAEMTCTNVALSDGGPMGGIQPLQSVVQPLSVLQAGQPWARILMPAAQPLEPMPVTVASQAPAAPRIPVEDPGRGTPLTHKQWVSYYFLAAEADYTSRATAVIRDTACNPIATVSKAFYDALCMQGSGKLTDGRIVNYARRCACAEACVYGSTTCYQVLPRSRYPWGAGARGKALIPLASCAVDRTKIPLGTVLYAPDWDGILIPKVGRLGGKAHDGCFRADDVGGGVRGHHLDLFAGTMGMHRILETLASGRFSTRSRFIVYKDAGRCAHLKTP